MQLALGALALALAVATKATALLALPVLALLAFGLTPRRRWPGVAVAGAAGIALGAFWYFVNRAETGSFIPRFAPTNQGGAASRTTRSFVKYPAQLSRLVIDAIDPAGSVGRDRWLYLVAAVIVLAVGLVVAARRQLAGRGHRSRRRRGDRRRPRRVRHAPRAAAGRFPTLLAGSRRARPGLPRRRPRARSRRRRSCPGTAPLGVLIVLAAVVLAVREVRRGALRKAALAVRTRARALPRGDHGRARLHAVPRPLPHAGRRARGATWGLVLRVRPLAWAAAAIATVTVILSFVHYVEKPAGFAVLGGGDVRSVWNESRIEILAHSRAPGGAGPLQVLEDEAADGDTVALQIRQDDVSYPFFGADLDRRDRVRRGDRRARRRGGLARRRSGPDGGRLRRGLALAARRRARLAALRARRSLSRRERRAIGLERRLRRGCPREPLTRSLPRGRAEPRAQRGIQEQALDCRPQRAGVPGRHEQARPLVLHGVEQPAHRRGDDGAAVCHCLAGDDAVALAPGGADDDGRAVVVVRRAPPAARTRSHPERRRAAARRRRSPAGRLPSQAPAPRCLSPRTGARRRGRAADRPARRASRVAPRRCRSHAPRTRQAVSPRPLRPSTERPRPARSPRPAGRAMARALPARRPCPTPAARTAVPSQARRSPKAASGRARGRRPWPHAAPPEHTRRETPAAGPRAQGVARRLATMPSPYAMPKSRKPAGETTLMSTPAARRC